eukprot:297160-Rhodomonas_salina.1
MREGRAAEEGMESQEREGEGRGGENAVVPYPQLVSSQLQPSMTRGSGGLEGGGKDSWGNMTGAPRRGKE